MRPNHNGEVGSAPGTASLAARDVNTTAILLALLVFLWGAVSLPLVPYVPFGPANIVQMAVGLLGFAAFAATRRRPSEVLAGGFSALVIAYALAIIPWYVVAWTRLGRPWEELVVPQIATLVMGLILPVRWWLGLLTMGLFTAEAVFVWIYAHHSHMPQLVPRTEPYASLGILALALGLFVLRQHRGALARHHIRIEAELEAMRRVSPLLTEVRDELEHEVATLVHETRPLGMPAAGMTRALDRLCGLRANLDALVRDPRAGSAEATAASERLLIDKDAQVSVVALMLIGIALWLDTFLQAHPSSHLALLLFSAETVLTLALLALVVARPPSRTLATAALLALFITGLPLVSFNQLLFLRAGRPFTPFLGHKVLMIALALTAASRMALSTILICVTALVAIVEYHALHMDRHRDVIALTEPWVTLVFLLIALISLRLRAQRRVASVRLLRAEAAASALHRRAAMLLAVRDRLSSPLQTLVVRTALLELQLSPAGRDRMQTALERLIAVNHTLAQLDAAIPPPSRRESLDAEAELRRRI